MFTKIDNLLLKICERFILRRIKKEKFLKHKYNIRSSWMKFDLSFLAAALLIEVIILFTEQKYYLAAIYIVCWMPSIGFRYLQLKRGSGLEEAYDWIWQNRKHPEVYKAIKELCELTFREEFSRRKKYFIMTAVLWCLILLLCFAGLNFLNIYLLFSLGLTTVDAYIHYVFDFDPPEDKRKEESDSKLTDLARKQLEKLFNDFAPRPI